MKNIERTIATTLTEQQADYICRLIGADINAMKYELPAISPEAYQEEMGSMINDSAIAHDVIMKQLVKLPPVSWTPFKVPFNLPSKLPPVSWTPFKIPSNLPSK